MLNIKTFKQLHSDAMGIGEIQGNLNQRLADVYRDNKASADYLEWVTATARDDSQGRAVQDKFALEVKAVQKNINLANTQKLMVNGKLTKEPALKKVRLMRANKPLMNDGLVTEQDIKAKKYFFITTDVTPPSEKPLDEKVANFMTRNTCTKKQLLKILAKMD
jgi:hypothetical protein